jgi:hypothetical protein
MNIKITRQDYHEYSRAERVDWLDRFAKEQVEKEKSISTVVDQARERNQKSMLDQISYVIDKKPRHASVESIVQEMQERTGLTEYIKRLSVTNSEQKKTAQEDEKSKVDQEKVLAQFDAELKKKILTFIKNQLESTRSNISDQAIIEGLARSVELKKMGLHEEDISNDDFRAMINQMKEDVQKSNPSQNANEDRLFGKEIAEPFDGSNEDVFKNMQPQNK